MKKVRYMNLYKSWISARVVACFGIAGLLVSCGGGETNTTETTAVDTVETTEELDITETQVYYQVPAPDEMISFIKAGGFEFNGEILNPVDNLDQHVDQKSQSLNLGIYTADLSYMASYGAFQESVRYFNVIMKLSDNLGISSAFDEVLISRVKSNLENTDSLESITADSYYSIVDNLEASQRGKTLAVIAAGGWLESIYIVVSLMEEFDADNSTVQRLADQKLVFENLMLYLEKYSNEMVVKSTIEDFEPLKEIFAGIEESSTTTSMKSEGGKMVLGGEGKITLSEENFNALKQEVIRLRNSIASVNS